MSILAQLTEDIVEKFLESPECVINLLKKLDKRKHNLFYYNTILGKRFIEEADVEFLDIRDKLGMAKPHVNSYHQINISLDSVSNNIYMSESITPNTPHYKISGGFGLLVDDMVVLVINNRKLKENQLVNNIILGKVVEILENDSYKIDVLDVKAYLDTSSYGYYNFLDTGGNITIRYLRAYSSYWHVSESVDHSFADNPYIEIFWAKPKDLI